MEKPSKPLTPSEAAELETRRREACAPQPYATELDARELEHAHKEKRPVEPEPRAAKPA